MNIVVVFNAYFFVTNKGFDKNRKKGMFFLHFRKGVKIRV
jgi:hypothetical protein